MNKHLPRVLIWVPVLDFQRGLGGAETLSLRLAGGLIEAGCRVTVLAPRIGWQRPARDSVSVNDRQVPILWFPSPGIWLLGSVIYLTFIAVYLLLVLPGLQVVHIGSVNRVAALMVLIAKIMGKKVICRAIGGDAWLLTELGRRGHPFSKLHLFALRRADCIVAQSMDSKEILSALGIDSAKIVHIPNGVDTAFFKPHLGSKTTLRARLGLTENGKIICCVNRLRPLKRVDVIINAFHRVVTKYPGSELVVVGDGSLWDELHQLAESLGVKNQVRFTGFVQKPLEYLQASDVFVIASDVENRSNALLEAMACGLPVVATEVGGNEECIQHLVNGVLVPPGAPSEMAQAILVICQDEILAARLGANARQSVLKHYTVERMVDQYLQLYHLPKQAA